VLDYLDSEDDDSFVGIREGVLLIEHIFDAHVAHVYPIFIAVFCPEEPNFDDYPTYAASANNFACSASHTISNRISTHELDQEVCFSFSFYEFLGGKESKRCHKVRK
jgi:hypothetical protein